MPSRSPVRIISATASASGSPAAANRRKAASWWASIAAPPAPTNTRSATLNGGRVIHSGCASRSSARVISSSSFATLVSPPALRPPALRPPAFRPPALRPPDFLVKLVTRLSGDHRHQIIPGRSRGCGTIGGVTSATRSYRGASADERRARRRAALLAAGLELMGPGAGAAPRSAGCAPRPGSTTGTSTRASPTWTRSGSRSWRSSPARAPPRSWPPPVPPGTCEPGSAPW